MSFSWITNKPKFAYLFWAQALGVLNDNLLRNAIVITVTFQNLILFGLPPKSLVALASATLIFPFLIFSPIAGQLADKFEKALIVRTTKLFEMAIALVAIFAFLSHSFELLVILLFLTGTQSALFSPVKYSALPAIFEDKQLTQANAMISLGTFVAILAGTILGGETIAIDQSMTLISALVFITAIFGLIAAYRLPNLGAANPTLRLNWNPIPETLSLIKIIIRDKALAHAVLGVSWFWFFGSALLSVLPVLVKSSIQGNESTATLFLALFTIGVGVGSWLASKLSFSRVEIGLVPIGALGLSVFLVDMVIAQSNWVPINTPVGPGDMFTSLSGLRIVFDYTMISLCGGIYFVPLNTFIQMRSNIKERSRVIAGNNLLNSLAMVLSTALLMSMYAVGFSVSTVLLTVAALNIVVSLYIYWVVPDFTLRFLAWIISNFLYRVRSVNLEKFDNIKSGLLICNHVSYVDWLIIYGQVPRPVRFIMYYKYYDIPVLRFFLNQAGAIPIGSSKDRPELVESALKEASKTLSEGGLICIFPEGRLTRDGNLEEFRQGILRIHKASPAPIIPMALSGLWGSMFSLFPGKLKARKMRWLWHPVGLEVGEPIDQQDIQIEQLKNAISNLTSDSQ